MEYAVKSTIFSAYLHQGEICMSADRIIVEKPIAEAFAQALAGMVLPSAHGRPERSHHLHRAGDQRQAQVKKIDGHVKDAVAKGAKLLAGGSLRGPAVPAHPAGRHHPGHEDLLRGDLRPGGLDHRRRQRRRGLAVANDTTYGLSAGVITKDLEKALYLGEGLEAGMVHVNDGTIDADACCPFGGCKGSGIGREGGRYSVEEMTELKWLTIQKIGAAVAVLRCGPSSSRVASGPRGRRARGVRLTKPQSNTTEVSQCRKEKAKPITNMKITRRIWPFTASHDTDDLVGQKMKLTLDNGHGLRPGVHRAQRGEVAERFGERRHRLVRGHRGGPKDLLHRHDLCRQPTGKCVTFFVNTETRRVLSVDTLMREGEIGHEPRAVQEFTPGVLGDPSVPPTGFKPGPTRDLIGLKAFTPTTRTSASSTTTSTASAYCWQCLVGPSEGRGGRGAGVRHLQVRHQPVHLLLA